MQRQGWGFPSTGSEAKDGAKGDSKKGRRYLCAEVLQSKRRLRDGSLMVSWTDVDRSTKEAW